LKHDARNHEPKKNILKCKFGYEIIVVLLRTLRLLGIKICELTEELGGWLYVLFSYEIIVVLLRTLRLLGIKICELTEELGGLLYMLFSKETTLSTQHRFVLIAPCTFATCFGPF
jgi:hypothetical protein